MPATMEQQLAHLAMTAPAARQLELTLDLPMELTVGKVALETGWGLHAPGNNYAGIKCRPNAPSGVPRETFEDLTADGVARFRAKGGVVKRQSPLESGKMRIWIDDWFLTFPSMDAFFAYYGKLIVEGTNFRDRFARYLQHRDVDQLMYDLAGADGKPVYFTGEKYFESWKSITQRPHVVAAIAAARRA